MRIISMAETNFNVYTIPIFVFLLTWLATNFLLKSKHHKLPPGPSQIPIFGNLLQLGSTPHRRLTELASTHGSLMTLRLGTRTAVVVSDAAAVRDVFSVNDHSLSNRGAYDANTALNHDKLSVLWLPNGSTWRYLRKIFTSNLFSGPSLDLSRHLRQRKVADLLSFVERCSAVDINDCVFNLTLNIMSNTIFSMDLADPSSPISKKFKEVIIGISIVSGKPNLTDFFPFLRVFDPQGIRRSVERYYKEMMSLIDGLIADRLAGNSGVPPESEQDMLGVLLKFSRDEESEITRAFISHIIMVSKSLIQVMNIFLDELSKTTLYNNLLVNNKPL
nr:8-hydroxylase [Fagopyrum tataricum]